MVKWLLSVYVATNRKQIKSQIDHFPIRPIWFISALCAWLAHIHSYLAQGEGSWGTFVSRDGRFREVKDFDQGNTANKRTETGLEFKLPRFSHCALPASFSRNYGPESCLFLFWCHLEIQPWFSGYQVLLSVPKHPSLMHKISLMTHE